jgi:hypothetical protein
MALNWEQARPLNLKLSSEKTLSSSETFRPAPQIMSELPPRQRYRPLYQRLPTPLVSRSASPGNAETEAGGLNLLRLLVLADPHDLRASPHPQIRQMAEEHQNPFPLLVLMELPPFPTVWRPGPEMAPDLVLVSLEKATQV